MADAADDLDSALREAALASIWRDSPDDVARDLGHVAHAVVSSLPGAVCAGLVELRDGTLHERYATGEDARRLAALQRRHHEGPAVTVATVTDGRAALRVEDLREAPASHWWPHVAPATVELGYRSLLCVRLPLGPEHPVCSLTVHGHHAGVFDDEARRTATVFAAHAAALLDGGRTAGAPGSADLLAQARGVVMERFGVDHHRALGQLMHLAAGSGLTVTAVAQWVIDDLGRRTASRAPVSRPTTAG